MIICIITKLPIEDIHFQSKKSMRFVELIQVLISDLAVILLHSSSDRVGLFQDILKKH